MAASSKGLDPGLITDERIKDCFREAMSEMADCRLCPWQCGADRLHGQIGRCGAAPFGEVFYAGLLMNEESDLNPAYEVFFTGCNLSCRFCYLAEKVRRAPGSHPAAPLAGHPLFRDQGLESARSLSAVGGEPAVNLAAALYLFGALPLRPRVWNSNMVYAPAVARMVARAADVVVADIHFGNDRCAELIAGLPGYLDTVLANLESARAAGLSVIVRHLPLPGHYDCCGRAVIRIMRDFFPALSFHVLSHYLPPPPVQAGVCRGLRRSLPPSDSRRLKNEAREAGLRLEPDGAPEKRAPGPADERGEIIIGADGSVIVPHLTPGLLELVRAIKEA